MKLVVFDMDDTIIDATKFMKEKAPSFIQKEYGITVEEVNPSGCDIKEVYGLISSFIDRGFRFSEAFNKSEEIQQNFWNQNFIKYATHKTWCKRNHRNI